MLDNDTRESLKITNAYLEAVAHNIDSIDCHLNDLPFDKTLAIEKDINHARGNLMSAKNSLKYALKKE